LPERVHSRSVRPDWPIPYFPPIPNRALGRVPQQIIHAAIVPQAFAGNVLPEGP
jgi:hypothetical protein